MADKKKFSGIRADIEDLPKNFGSQKIKNIKKISDARDQAISENSLNELSEEDVIDLPEALRTRAMNAWKAKSLLDARKRDGDPQFGQPDEAEAWARAIEGKDELRAIPIRKAQVVPSDGNPDVRPAVVDDADSKKKALQKLIRSRKGRADKDEGEEE